MSILLERLDILKRIAIRGKSHMLYENNSRGVDLFEHLLTEIEYTIEDAKKMENDNERV